MSGMGNGGRWGRFTGLAVLALMLAPPALAQSEAGAPVEEADAPAEEADAPAEEADAPAEEADAPAEEVDAPAEEADAPAEEADAPAEEADAPAEGVEVSPEEPAAEEASAPPEEATGRLQVNSPMPGAQVYINNQLIGTTPMKTTLPPGPYTIRITADGFDPFVRRVDVEANQNQSINAELIPGRGTVEFLANTRGAKVIIDGRREWPLPVRLSDISPGSYRFEIQAPGHDSHTGEFQFTTGRNVFIYEELVSSLGKVEIVSEPDGATVFLDGEQVGVTPLQLNDVPAARHVVRLEMSKRATVFRTLDTSDGSRGQLEARLPDSGAALKIRTGSEDGEVRLEGHLIGTGSNVAIDDLERGFYNIEVSRDGYKPATSRLDVPASGTLIYEADFREPDANSASRLLPVTPLVQRWTFWTATGAGAAAVGVGGFLIWRAIQPEPIPEGDYVVTLP